MKLVAILCVAALVMTACNGAVEVKKNPKDATHVYFVHATNKGCRVSAADFVKIQNGDLDGKVPFTSAGGADLGNVDVKLATFPELSADHAAAIKDSCVQINSAGKYTIKDNVRISIRAARQLIL